MSLFTAKSAQALPSYGETRSNNCNVSGCHVASTGNMSINSTYIVNLSSGSLKTFAIDAGKKVTLSMNVLNGADSFAVQLKNMETGGVEFSPLNKLVWSAVNPGNIWVKHPVGASTTPYYTKELATNKGIVWTTVTHPVTYTFDMQVDINTPPDTYKLTFAVAGQTGDWYQEENFYLEVLCPYALAGDANGDCKINMLDLALMAQKWLVDCVHYPRPAACVLK